MSKKSEITKLYLLMGYLSVQLHEVGHIGTAKLLGLDFLLGFNRWQTVSQGELWQQLAVTTAGPIVTLMFAVVGLALVYCARNGFLGRIGLLLMVFNSVVALFNHLLYFVQGSQGDERWIAYYLQVPEYLVRIPFIVFYVIALFLGFRKTAPDFRTFKVVAILFLSPIGLSALVYAIDILTWNEMERGSVLFQPIGGVSTAVLVVNTLAMFALLYVLPRSRRFYRKCDGYS